MTRSGSSVQCPFSRYMVVEARILIIMQKGKVNISDVNIKLELCNNVFALVNKKEEETTLHVHMLTFLRSMQNAKRYFLLKATVVFPHVL